MKAVLDFASDGRTLVVVTGDHETGGLTLHPVAGDALRARWGSNDHTVAPIPIYAGGPGARAFSGVKHNTELFEGCSRKHWRQHAEAGFVVPKPARDRIGQAGANPASNPDFEQRRTQLENRNHLLPQLKLPTEGGRSCRCDQERARPRSRAAPGRGRPVRCGCRRRDSSHPGKGLSQEVPRWRLAGSENRGGPTQATVLTLCRFAFYDS